MRETIIADASCFIILSNIGELEILQKTYGTVVTTSIILGDFGEPAPEWVIVRDPTSQNNISSIKNLGKGETSASAIALAMEIVDSVVILDDQQARNVALQIGLTVTGTLAVFVRAKANGVIPAIKPLIEKMRRTNFRVSAKVELEALQKAGEDQA